MLVLASRSPQRRAILSAIGIDFRVAVSAFVETERGSDPVALARANAEGKARDVAEGGDLDDGDVVLGVDTVVVLDGRSLGSPADRVDATAMLTALAGRAHVVVSAICLVSGTRVHTATSETIVRFRTLRPDEIAGYVVTGEWRDRAGGYAIQAAGMALVAEIHGDYSNVVGLPVATLLRGLGELGRRHPG